MRVVAALAGILFVTACSPIPLASTYPLSIQQKMQSVEHWQILAQDVEHQIHLALGEQNRPIYVTPKSAGAFGQAFETYLTTALMGDGYTVSASPERSVVIDYGLQRVVHDGAHEERTPPGFFTAMGSGVWLGIKAAGHWSAHNGAAAAIPLGAAADITDGMTVEPTNTEVIISANAVFNDHYIMRLTRNYYVNDLDAEEYPEILTAEVSGPARAMPLSHVVMTQR